MVVRMRDVLATPGCFHRVGVSVHHLAVIVVMDRPYVSSMYAKVTSTYIFDIGHPCFDQSCSFLPEVAVHHGLKIQGN